MPCFYSYSIRPLEMQEMSSDIRIESERPPDKITEGEPANGNSHLTPEQPDSDAASVNRCERFVKTVFQKYFGQYKATREPFLTQKC